MIKQNALVEYDTFGPLPKTFKAVSVKNLLEDGDFFTIIKQHILEFNNDITVPFRKVAKKRNGVIQARLFLMKKELLKDCLIQTTQHSQQTIHYVMYLPQ